MIEEWALSVSLTVFLAPRWTRAKGNLILNHGKAFDATSVETFSCQALAPFLGTYVLANCK